MSSKASCPECEVTLPKPHAHRGPSRCDQCKGLWYDEKAVAVLAPDLPPWSLPVENAPKRLCPACAIPLVTRSAGKVEVCACPVCQGVFLAEGALEALVAARHEREAQAQRELEQAAREEAHVHSMGNPPPNPHAVAEYREAYSELAARRTNKDAPLPSWRADEED